MRYASAAEAAAHPGIGTAVATVCVSGSNSSTCATVCVSEQQQQHILADAQPHDKAGATLKN
jgi:hypothetical protein